MRWRRAGGLQRANVERPIALRGALWVGDGTSYDDGRVVVDVNGMVSAVGAASDVEVPFGAQASSAAWIGPGIVDAHVHLAFGDPDHALAHGVVAVRDLGAPPADAVRWRQLDAPRVDVAGPLLTAPGGYPSRSWGSAGFAAFVDDPDQAQRLVSGLATQVDVVKVALEPSGGPVPSAEVLDAIVVAAHDNGLPVTVHALTTEMVDRALIAGIDELAHTPTEQLPAEVVQRIAAAGTTVVSTLQTFVAGGIGEGALGNAAALVEAGATLRYGTDLGNAGTRPGVDPRELSLLADRVGLGADGALRAATVPVQCGSAAALVALKADPRQNPTAWRDPVAVVVGNVLLHRPEPA
jgi:imidazolonepropionase-like amidohydrolase